MNDLLDLMVDQGASDLHLQVGQPPTIRLSGSMTPIDGPALTPADTEKLMLSITPDGHVSNVKLNGGADFGFAFGEKARLFALITNVLAKDKEIEDGWRHYPRPTSARNRANMVEDEVVDALVSAVRAAYPRLAHRYYAMKAGWLGLPKLKHWDRNAPLPQDEDARIAWPDAVSRVLDAYVGGAHV